MKVIAFDTCSCTGYEPDQDRCQNENCKKYQKKWDTLAPNIEVVIKGFDDKWKSLAGTLEEPWLLLVHKSCDWVCPPENGVPDRGFVMYVSGSRNGCSEKDNSDLPRIHYSKRCVPTGSDLSFLRDKFKRLCIILEENDQGKDVTIEMAWAAWESSFMEGLIETLSPLLLVPDNAELESFVRNQLDLLIADAKEKNITYDILPAISDSDLTEPLKEILEALLSPQDDKTAAEKSTIDSSSLLGWIKKYPACFSKVAGRYL